MNYTQIASELDLIFKKNANADQKIWFEEKLYKINSDRSKRIFYTTYTLIKNIFQKKEIDLKDMHHDSLRSYLRLQKIDLSDFIRIYLLIKVLEADKAYFTEPVVKMIEVADTSELISFLKCLVLLPDAEDFKTAAVEALRTNITSVFEAIALQNPYPGLYFSQDQWNQMYLKAAFMQLDLFKIRDIDKMANRKLATIISDYAHERWKASRDVDPYFWRPVSGYLNEILLKDMQRLLDSANHKEKYAGALCCYNSENPEAQQLLNAYPKLSDKIKNGQLHWDDVKLE